MVLWTPGYPHQLRPCIQHPSNIGLSLFSQSVVIQGNNHKSVWRRTEKNLYTLALTFQVLPYRHPVSPLVHAF